MRLLSHRVQYVIDCLATAPEGELTPPGGRHEMKQGVAQAILELEASILELKQELEGRVAA